MVGDWRGAYVANQEGSRCDCLAGERAGQAEGVFEHFENLEY